MVLSATDKSNVKAAWGKLMAQRPWRGEHRTCPAGIGPHAGRVLVPGRPA